MAIVPVDINDGGGGSDTSQTSNLSTTDFVIGGVTPSQINVGNNPCCLVKVGDIGVWNSYPMTNSCATSVSIPDAGAWSLPINGASYVEAITGVVNLPLSDCSCTLHTKLYIDSQTHTYILAELTHHHTYVSELGGENFAILNLSGALSYTNIRIPGGFSADDSYNFFVRMYICNSQENVPGTSAKDPFVLYVDYGYRHSSQEVVMGSKRTSIHYNGQSGEGPLCSSPYVQYRRTNDSGTGPYTVSNLSCAIKTVKIRD